MSNGKVSFSDFSQASFSDGKRLESATAPLNNVLQNDFRSSQSLEHHITPSVSAPFSISASSSPTSPSSIGIPASSDTPNQKEMCSTMWFSQQRLAKDNHHGSLRSAKKNKAGLSSTSLQVENEERRAGNHSFGSSSSSRNSYFSSLSTQPTASLPSTEEMVAEQLLQQISNPPRVSGGGSNEIEMNSVEENITKRIELPCMVSSLSLPHLPTSLRSPAAQELGKFSSSCTPSRCTQFSMEPSPLDNLEEKRISKSTDPLWIPSMHLNNDPNFISISSSLSSRNVCTDNDIQQNKVLDPGDKRTERLCASSAPAVIRREKALPSPTGPLMSCHSLEKLEKGREREVASSGGLKNSDGSANNSTTSLHADKFFSAAGPLSPQLSPRESSACTLSTVASVMTNSTSVVATPPKKKSLESNEKCRRIECSASSTLPAKLMETVSSTLSPEIKIGNENGESQGRNFSHTSSTESSLSTSAVQLVKSITELPSSVRCSPQLHSSSMDENEASKPATVVRSQGLSREHGEKKKGTRAVGTALANAFVPFYGASSHHSLPFSASASSSASLTHEASREGNALPQPLAPLPQQQQLPLHHHPPPNSPNAKDVSPQSYASPIPLPSRSSTAGNIGRANAYIQTDPSPFFNVAIGTNFGAGEGQSDPTGVFLGPQYSAARPLEALSAAGSMNMPHQASQTPPSSMPSHNSVQAAGGGRSNFNRPAFPLPNPSTLSAPSSSWVIGGGGGTAPIDSLLIQVSEMSFLDLLQVYVDCCLDTNEEDYKAKREVFEDVQAVVKSQFGIKADVHIYGSVITNLALPNSDIDLLVTGYHPCSPLETMQTLSAALLEVDEQKLLAMKTARMQAIEGKESPSQGADSDGEKSCKGEDRQQNVEIEASRNTENEERKANQANDASEGVKHPVLQATNKTNATPIFAPSTIQDVPPPVTPFLSMSSLLQSNLENIVPQEEGFVNPNASSEKELYTLPEELETAEEVYRNQIEKDYTFSAIGDYSALWQSSRSTAISASTAHSKGTNTAEVIPAPSVPLMTKIAANEKYRGEPIVDCRSDGTNENKGSISATLLATTTSTGSSCSSSSSSSTGTTATSAASLSNSGILHLPRTSAAGSISDAHSGDFSKENLASEEMKIIEEGKKQQKDDPTLSPENTSSTGGGKGKGNSWSNSETLPSFGGTFGTSSSANKNVTLNHNNHTSSAAASRAGIPSYYTIVPTVNGVLYRVQTITSARIPVIKITNINTNQRADITFGGGEHFRSLQMTKTLLEVFPPSHDLILFVKHCVARMGIGELTTGGITSFTIYLMVRHLYNILLNYIARRYHEIETHMMEASFPHYRSESGVRNNSSMRGSGVADGSSTNPHISSMMASSLYADNPSLPSSSVAGETFGGIPPPSGIFGSSASPPLPLSPSMLDEVDMLASMYCRKFGRFHRHQHVSERVQLEERQQQQGGSLFTGSLSTSSDRVNHVPAMPTTEGEGNLMTASIEENCLRSVGLHGSPPSSASCPSIRISEKDGRRREGSAGGSKTDESSVSASSEIPFSTSYSVEVEQRRDVEREDGSREEQRSKNRSSDRGSSSKRTTSPFFAQDSVQKDGEPDMGTNEAVSALHSSCSSPKDPQKDKESSHSYPPATLSLSPTTTSPQQEGSNGSALLPFQTSGSTPAIPSTTDGGSVVGSSSEAAKPGLLPTALSRCSSSSSSSSPCTGDKDAEKRHIDTELPIREEDPEVSAMFHYEIAAMIIRNHVSFTTILRDFCAYYGCIFNYETQGIHFSPNGTSEVVPKPFLCSRRGQLFHMTSPFDPGYDITARMTCMREFQWMCGYFSAVVIPSFSFYAFLTWLHAPSAIADLYAVRNHLFLPPHIETATVSASPEGGIELGDRDVYPATEPLKKKRPSPPPLPKTMATESMGSAGEEGGMRKPDASSSFYFKKSHPHKDRNQTPPPLAGRNREGLHLPSGEGQCTPSGTSEEAAMRQHQGSSSQRSHHPIQKVAAESSPHNTSSPPSTSTGKNNRHGDKNRTDADGKRKMMSGKGVDGALSPPLDVSFSSVHAGGNHPQAFPISPPPAPLASGRSPHQGNQGGGKGYMATISSAVSVSGGGAASNLPPPALSSLPNGFLHTASHPSTSTNGGVSNRNTPSATNGLLFHPPTQSYAIPFPSSTGGLGHESYAPNSWMLNGNAFPRYLYTGGERGGGSNVLPLPVLAQRTADSMSFMNPSNNVYMTHGGANGRGIGDGVSSGGTSAGSFPIFPGGYPQYYDPMVSGNPVGSLNAVASHNNYGNSEMIMQMNGHPQHMNPSASNGTTASVGASMMPSPAGVPMAFHMGSPGMMPGGLPLSSATPNCGTNGGGVPSNTTNVSSNTNNGNNTTMMPVFGSPSPFGYHFAVPHGSSANINEDIGHRLSHPPHSHPHNSSQTHFPSPPSPSLSASQQHHNGMHNNNGGSALFSGGSSSNSNGSSGSKMSHNAPGNMFFGSATNVNFPSHGNPHHNSHDPSAGGKGGGGPPFPGYHIQQYPSFLNGEFQAVNGGRASGGGQKSSSTSSRSAMKGRCDDSSVYSPPAKSKGKAKGGKHNEEASPHSESTSLLVGKEKMSEKRLKTDSVLLSTKTKIQEQESSGVRAKTPVTFSEEKKNEKKRLSLVIGKEDPSFPPESGSPPRKSLKISTNDS